MMALIVFNAGDADWVNSDAQSFVIKAPDGYRQAVRFVHVADRQYNSAVIFKTEFLILELEALLQIIHP